MNRRVRDSRGCVQLRVVQAASADESAVEADDAGSHRERRDKGPKVCSGRFPEEVLEEFMCDDASVGLPPPSATEPAKEIRHSKGVALENVETTSSTETLKVSHHTHFFRPAMSR